MREILPQLQLSSGEPLYLQLYKYIKGEIEKGSMLQGDKLPSIRMLSSKLGVSITTIRTAYDQLLMEGYIASHEKSGYYVSEMSPVSLSALPESRLEGEETAQTAASTAIYDMSCFDFVKWKKCLGSTLIYDAEALLAEADFQGERAFREQIRKYIYQSRGVHAAAEDIVVGAGTQQIMNLIANILKSLDKGTIGFENPGYMLSELIFRNQSFKVVDMVLDKEGLNIDNISSEVDLLYVSPSHQFPTGIVMSAGRRMKLLSWANDKDGYIIEDDYDSELRYFGKPIPSLKAMDKNDRVIHMGSFSSTLLPSIRISYVVLPPKLAQIYKEIKLSYSQGVSKVDQLTLTKFMEEGHYQRHIKRIRRLYSEKSNQLSEFLQANYPQKIKIISNTSGLFVIIDIRSKKSEVEIAALFAKHGVKATPYKNYVKTAYQAEAPRILLYFYNIIQKNLHEIIQSVMTVVSASESQECADRQLN